MIYTGTNQGKYAFHFVADTLRDGRPIPADGVWLEHEGNIEICTSGLHASWEVADALQYAPGPNLCLVEVVGIIQQQDDKLVARRRRIVARFDATDLLRADARESARSVLGNWRGPVPQVVVNWLTTGDEQYRREAQSAAWSAAWSAAESAAWSAAQSAAWSAAWSAARSAAWSAAQSAAALSAALSAAWSAARKRLHYAVMQKFEDMGVISR